MSISSDLKLTFSDWQPDTSGETKAEAAWSRVAASYTKETGNVLSRGIVLDAEPSNPKFEDDPKFIRWVKPFMIELGYHQHKSRRRFYIPRGKDRQATE